MMEAVKDLRGVVYEKAPLVKYPRSISSFLR